MKERCFFCEYDYGPSMNPTPECCTCVNHELFRPKKRMGERMAAEYEKFKKFEEWTEDKTEEFDRATALAVLKALSKHLYPSYDLFGNATLVIDRYKFELVRKKFLDDAKGERK